ncbi:peptidylprolyl isomerase [Providencia heimbachae]|nr:peptidylprolyl isomerase [Providencia sp.]NIH22057.1 peptidylprolyl isomerase [Providencia heimbachae]
MDLNKTIARLQQENESLKSKPASSNKGLAGRVNPKAPSAQDLKQIANENSKRNEKIIEQITQQKYSKLDSNTYYKVLQAGSPITNVKNKDITFIMREQLTDGTVTVMYTDKNPVTLPYNELPTPLNSFIEKAGEGGMVKVYIKPEGGYGVQGIPGEVPPNSMSIIDLKIIKAK